MADHGVYERSGRVGNFSEDFGADFCACLSRAALKDAFAVEQSDPDISIPEYWYRAQGVFDVSSFGGSFDAYMRSLPNIARNYAKHCMKHFEKEVSPADDLQLVVRLPPNLAASCSKVDKLTTSHGRQIDVLHFHDVFNGKVRDFLDIAWDDILDMSWHCSVRQSTSGEVALQTCLLHLVAFDSGIRANDAVTVGLQRKSTSEWLGFFAYHFVINMEAPTDNGIGGSLAQGLAVLSRHDEGSAKRKSNIWFLLFQQCLVNHVITVWGDKNGMPGVKWIDMVVSPLNTRWLADQKVRLFVPVVQQRVRVVRIQEDEEQGQFLRFMLGHVQGKSLTTSYHGGHGNSGIIGVPDDMTLTQVFREDAEIRIDDAQDISAVMSQESLTGDTTWYFVYGAQNCDSSVFTKLDVDPLILQCFNSHSGFFSRVNVAVKILMSKQIRVRSISQVARKCQGLRYRQVIQLRHPH